MNNCALLDNFDAVRKKSMKIDREALHKIAHLARLEIKKEDEAALMESLSETLTWVTKLDEIDTEGVEPLTSMSKEVNALREDIPNNALQRESGLKNAPSTDGEFFKVPKFLD